MVCGPVGKHRRLCHAGKKLGVITDYLCRELETITAPASGVLLILFGTPPVNEGDAVVVIGEIDEL